MNEKFLDPKTKVLISNQRKNCIDIDSSSRSSEPENNSDYSDQEEKQNNSSSNLNITIQSDQQLVSLEKPQLE
jgi:hypothetical protein